MTYIKCCVCSKINVDKNNPVFAQLKVSVPWKYPTWGNFPAKIYKQGIAVLCDDCNGPHTDITAIKEVVEWEGNQVHYHPIIWINGVPKLLTGKPEDRGTIEA